MYACDNCGAHVPLPRGRCPTCNIRLHAGNVTAVGDESPAPGDADLDVSHRCGNCGEAVVSEGGKCRHCRFPIPSAQLRHVPEATVIPLAERIALDHAAAPPGRREVS